MDLKLIPNGKEGDSLNFKTGYEGTGERLCHRFTIRYGLHHDSGKPNPLIPQAIDMECMPQGHITFIPCIKSQCALWDRSSKEEFKCSDFLANQAAARSGAASGKS